jgi:hypothetical protein
VKYCWKWNGCFSYIVAVSFIGGENHRPVASHWQTLSHNVVSGTPRHERGSKSQRVSGDRHWTHKTSLTPHHFIVAHVPSQESEHYCNCVLEIIDIKKGLFIFLRYFYFILKLLRQCDILCFSSFHFITEIWRIISYQTCIRCYLGILSICKNYLEHALQ